MLQTTLLDPPRERTFISTQKMVDWFTKLSDSLTTRGPSEKWLVARAAAVNALNGYRPMLIYARQRAAGAPVIRYLEPRTPLTDKDIQNIRAASGMNRRLGIRLRQIQKSERKVDVDKKTPSRAQHRTAKKK